MIDSAGLILSTSVSLDAAPLVNFTTAGGVTGSGWVRGRDDSKDVALLEVIDAAGPYAFLPIIDLPVPDTDEEVLVLGFPTARDGTLDTQQTRVVGSRQDFNTGIRYIQMNEIYREGVQGSAVVDRAGVLRGLKMDESNVVTLGVGRTGETWVMAIDAVTLLMPQLQSGDLTECRSTTAPVSESPGAPPGITPQYVGTISIGGAAPSNGTLLYSRVVKAGLPDWWVCVSFPLAIGAAGNYAINLGGSDLYNGGAVEFWTNGKRAAQTNDYLLGEIVTLNLTFP